MRTLEFNSKWGSGYGPCAKHVFLPAQKENIWLFKGFFTEENFDYHRERSLSNQEDLSSPSDLGVWKGHGIIELPLPSHPSPDWGGCGLQKVWETFPQGWSSALVCPQGRGSCCRLEYLYAHLFIRISSIAHLQEIFSASNEHLSLAYVFQYFTGLVQKNKIENVF